MFKKKLLLILLLTECIAVYAQQVTPSNSASMSLNYVRKWEVYKPDSSRNNFTLSTSTQDAKITTEYVDGLGRPIQTVIKQGSFPTGGSAVDLVIPTIYDGFGKESVKYLPFVANTAAGNSSVNDGIFKMNPFHQDSVFSTSQYTGETWFYSRTNYEPSLLNRITERFAAGNSWVGSSGQSLEVDRHSSKMKYWINTNTDSVRIWTVTDNTNDFGTYVSSSVYAPGTLFKNATTDEQGNQVIEFKNKEDKLVLRKVQLFANADTGTGKGYYGWLCTYYIYDLMGRVRAIVQPLGVDALKANSWTFNSTILNEMCFRYEFDGRNRMKMKKMPGAEVIYLVYDTRDRLVFTQDAILRTNNQWNVSLYDRLNRPVQTGIMTYNSSLTSLQSEVTSQTQTPTTPNINASLDITLSINNTIGTYSALRTVILADGFESGTTTDFIAQIVNGPSGADGETFVVENTEVNKNPIPSGGTFIALTKTYYDDYDWSSKNYTTAYNNQLDGGSNPNAESALSQPNIQVKGLVTVSQIRVIENSSNLSTGPWVSSVNFYDTKNRVIQSHSENIKGGTDIVSNLYDFSGKVLCSYWVQNNPVAIPAQTRIRTSITYDPLGRMIETWKTINDVTAEKKLTGSTQYNSLGQVKTKKLAPAYNSNAGLETFNYDYSIRGWMLGMNRGYVKDTTSTSSWFGFDLGYDKTDFSINGTSKSFNAAQFSGNIAGMLWKSTGDDQLRKYDFSYDATDRMVAADFNQLTNNVFSKSAGIDYSVSGMNYDANGNILTMNQRGWTPGGSKTIDSLLYTYYSGSNKLMNVLDRKNDTATKLGDFRSSKAYMTSLGNNKTTSAIDYTYDLNGSLTIDNNKDVSFIHYNHLNLPDSIAITGKGYIKYTYDALGNKLRKTTTETGIGTTTTLYILGTVYQNDTLQFLTTEDGRIRWKPNNTFQYDYFLKDQLGNIRMVLTEEQQSDAYQVASLENTPLNNEKKYYSGLDTGRVNKSTVADYPTDTYTNPNDFVQKLNGSSNKVGAGIVLKVMAGDKFNLRVNSWWKSVETPGSPANPLSSILSLLNSGIGNVAGNHTTATELSDNSTLNPAVTSFLSSQSGYTASRPKAFINWVLFDEQFKYVSGSSGFEQVDESNIFTTHIKNGQSLSKNGYLYIYVSNVTPNIDVIFDNLQVTHLRGPLVEETHYYPFGLTMNGISSKALAYGDPKNKHLFNGKEFISNEFTNSDALSNYDFGARMQDPQIGRWMVVDQKSDSKSNLFFSPYTYTFNNPVNNVDPNGKENEPALLWALRHLLGVAWERDDQGVGKGYYEKNAFKPGNVPSYGVCYDLVWTSYMNGGTNLPDYLMNAGLADKGKNGVVGFKGRIAAIDWFKEGNKTPEMDRQLQTSIGSGEQGDIVFMGENTSMGGHAVILADCPRVYDNGNAVELITLSTGADMVNGKATFGLRHFNFRKNKDGEFVWTNSDGSVTYKFVGFGQLLNTMKIENNVDQKITDQKEIAKLLSDLQKRH